MTDPISVNQRQSGVHSDRHTARAMRRGDAGVRGEIRWFVRGGTELLGDRAASLQTMVREEPPQGNRHLAKGQMV